MSVDRPDGSEAAHELLHEVISELYPEPGEAQSRLAELEAQEALGSFETEATDAERPSQGGGVLRHLVTGDMPLFVGLGGTGAKLVSVHRSIVALDVERSTSRQDSVKAELKTALYGLVDRALHEAGYDSDQLEPVTDRGDGVLILFRPTDSAPMSLVFNMFIPALTALLSEHNAAERQPLRLRAVVHAGEVQYDGRGFIGSDLDIAFRLLEAPKLKRALGEAAESPLALVVSEAMFSRFVRQRIVDPAPYEPLVRVRVGNKTHRGWVHIPSSKGFHRQIRPQRRGRNPRR